ncbi:flavoprotein [Trametes punicea]|nr:flavoprotein [Trametes punicea]
MSQRSVAEEGRPRTVGHTHVAIITTGSVASIKTPLIVAGLLQYRDVEVRVVATERSLSFYKISDIVDLGAQVFRDQDEWGPNGEYILGDPILHIDLRRWADIVLVAPCTANTLSKIANGLCDNLATSLLRALAPTTPTYVFPAMNTLMYQHPLTEGHLRTVREVIGYNVVGPIEKKLACNDVGLGAMVEWQDIVQIVVDRMKLEKKTDGSPETPAVST